MDSVYCIALAFAGDFARVWFSQGKSKNLKNVEKFCNKTGLKINVNEILGFSMVLKKKTLFFNIVEVGFKMY